ncbi:uncharacterized protein LOC118190995 [Stegodyphus dumicola]|uniref:uncharacterized protein LOC118190995 n=1 Tax=Stegodyphus dumicola TaxID=202533 RepID=UPI0015ADD84C|nr:uncharacterized protein LOC118190995 [Stegodyphus dumicola]
MLNFLIHCLLALCLASSSCAIMIGKMRNKEEPGTNVVQTSRFLFPRTNDIPPCKTDHGLFGQCVDVRLCYAARRAVSTGNHPVRCGWINNYIPMVCCHPDQVQHPKLVFRSYRSRRRNWAT